MRRFGKYVVSALVTFTLGLLCSFLTGGELLSSKKVREIQPVPLEAEGDPALVLRNVGHGLTGDGYETHYFDYRYSNGSYRRQYSIFYRSPERAAAELQKRIKQAAEIIRREPLFDQQGRQIGEKLVATFASENQTDLSSAEFLWTEHGRLVVQQCNSSIEILRDFHEKR
jgi:hypothetical protein